MRPLWIKADLQMALTAEVALAFPRCMMQDPISFAKRCQELGFDALVLGLLDPKEAAENYQGSYAGSLDWMASFKQLGLTLLIKPQCLPEKVHELYCKLPFVDAVFWESTLPQQLEATQYDLVKEELQSIERQLKGKTGLIFYVPFDEQNSKRQSKWLSKLCDEASQNTTIAFSSHSGPPWHDHLQLHPFWEELARAPDISETALMPIVNTGLVEKGEGLWPNIPFDLFDRVLSRCVKHHFSGPLSIASHLPGYGGTLECSLWMSAQFGLTHSSAELLAATWLMKNRPDLEFEPWRKMMLKGREMTLELGVKLPSKELSRLHIESLLSRLKFEENFFEQGRLSAYFSAFSSDVKKELIQMAKVANVSLFGNLESKNSYWETAEGKNILKENFFI